MYETKILGAGISGLTSAIVLAKAGKKVTVFERADTCGKRFLGDMQGIENWSEETDALKEIQGLGIKTSFNHKAFSKLSLTDGKEIVDLSFKRPLFYLVKRGPMEETLDQDLQKQALDEGVNIKFNSTCHEKDANIIATGPSLKNFTAFCGGIGFKTYLEDMAVGMVNDSTGYKGYSYLLVNDGYACICSVNINSGNQFKNVENAKAIFTKLFGFDVIRPKRLGGIGSFSLNNILVSDSRLYVGEAAGLQDFMWGFGIKSAMVSGTLAARSIIERSDYAKLMKARYPDYAKASVSNRLIWENFALKNYKTFMKVAKHIKDPDKRVRSIYKLTASKKLIFWYAKRKLKEKYPKAFTPVLA